MDIEKYFQRMDIRKPIKTDLESLSYLQNQHLLTIPFENLDVLEKIHIGLDPETYYEKIILGNRGGACHELNGLFNKLLLELGFSAYLVGATMPTKDGGWDWPETHAAQIIELDQPYLVDVGFGNSARRPLPLNGERREDLSGQYRIIKTHDKYYHKQRLSDGQWKTLYRFQDSKRVLSDFSEISHHLQTSPESHFTYRRLVTIATKEGRKTLSYNTLTVVENGNRSEKEVDEKDIPALLSKEFNI